MAILHPERAHERPIPHFDGGGLLRRVTQGQWSFEAGVAILMLAVASGVRYGGWFERGYSPNFTPLLCIQDNVNAAVGFCVVSATASLLGLLAFQAGHTIKAAYLRMSGLAMACAFLGMISWSFRVDDGWTIGGLLSAFVAWRCLCATFWLAKDIKHDGSR